MSVVPVVIGVSGMIGVVMSVVPVVIGVSGMIGVVMSVVPVATEASGTTGAAPAAGPVPMADHRLAMGVRPADGMRRDGVPSVQMVVRRTFRTGSKKS